MAMAQGEHRGEIESSNNQSTGAVDHGREMSIMIPTLPQWLAEKLDSVKDEQPKNSYDLDDREPKGKPKIQRVPEILRRVESNKDCYEPLIISLGPFHHKNSKLEQMEKLKISMLQRFIEGTKKSPAEVYDSFLKVAKNAKTEYYVLGHEENSISDEEFLCILFVDVCFVIQFILVCTVWDEYVRTEMGSREIAFVQRDLFLLENQLPFPVLKALMTLRFSENEFFRIIRRFIRNIIAIRPKRASWHRRMQIMLQMMLHMVKSMIVKTESDPESADSEQPLHLLHALQLQLNPREERSPRSVLGRIEYSYRSAMELKAAGVDFKSLMTRSGRLTDTRFDPFSGCLSLRPVVIDSITKVRFLNLCAFEALSNAPENQDITTYLWFMDSLIHSAEDVKELRSRGVLINRLGSDQDVVDMFKGITDRLVPNREAYAEVLSAIETQCNSHVRTWMAQFRQQHCSSPFTILGFMLAAFAIALSVIQTYYQVYPQRT